jgi:hypothetical protein
MLKLPSNERKCEATPSCLLEGCVEQR